MMKALFTIAFMLVTPFVNAAQHYWFTEADVHTWVLSENGELSGESHDTFRDWSAGLSLGVDVRVTRSIKAGCLYLKDVGDMDKIGTDNMLGCGLGFVF